MSRIRLARVFGVALCVILSLNSVPVTAQGAAALLKAGETKLLAGDPAEAVKFFEVAAARKESGASDRARYLKGTAFLLGGRLQEAREAYADYLLEYPSGAYVPEARLGIAAANERLGRTREAIEIYRAVVAQHPGIASEPWILAKLGDLLTSTLPEEAARYRRLFATKYPGFAGTPSAPAILSTPTAYPAPDLTPVSRLPVPAPAAPPSSTPAAPATRVAPAPVPVRAESSGPPHSIQAGAFGVRENADRLAATIRARGIPARVEQRRNLHAVIAGPFPGRAAAEQTAPVIAELVGGKVLILLD